MKKGICLKCNSNAVFKKEKGVSAKDTFVSLSGWFPDTNYETYLCTECGFYENYILSKDKLETVAKGKYNWTKV